MIRLACCYHRCLTVLSRLQQFRRLLLLLLLLRRHLSFESLHLRGSYGFRDQVEESVLRFGFPRIYSFELLSQRGSICSSRLPAVRQVSLKSCPCSAVTLCFRRHSYSCLLFCRACRIYEVVQCLWLYIVIYLIS